MFKQTNQIYCVILKSNILASVVAPHHLEVESKGQPDRMNERFVLLLFNKPNTLQEVLDPKQLLNSKHLSQKYITRDDKFDPL